MYVLRSKLKHLGQRHRIWNREHFGLIHERINKAKQCLDDIQKDLDIHSASEVHPQSEAGAQKTYLDALRDGETFWCDKAHISWLSEGDHSTTLFHIMARQRAIQNRIQLLCDRDINIEDPAELVPMLLPITILFTDPSSPTFRRALLIVSSLSLLRLRRMILQLQFRQRMKLIRPFLS